LWRKTVVTDFRLLVGITGLGLDLLFPLFSDGVDETVVPFNQEIVSSIERGMFLGESSGM
jgi:hypothetical protein